MATQNTGPVDESDPDIEPAEAFAILADPNRIDIIKGIVESAQDVVSFSDLYERTDFRDTGQFNYHLDKLVGPFLRKTDEGYSVRQAGRIVHRLAVSGLLSDRGEAEITKVDTVCPQCRAEQLTAVYEGDRFWIRCEDCGHRSTVGPFPPRALANYDPDRAPLAFDQYMMGMMVRAAENVCQWCASPLSPSLEPADASWPAVDWVIRKECDHCQWWIYTRVHELLRLHPAVIAFYYDHGLDILRSSFWEVEEVMAEHTTVVDDSDEWVATVTLTYDGDEIELGIAEDMRASTIEVLDTDT